MSTTRCEALAFITLTFFMKLMLATKETTTTLSGNWFNSRQPFEFAFTAVVDVHCLQSCL